MSDIDTGAGSPPLSTLSLFLSLCCPLAVVLMSYIFKVKLEMKLLIAVFRSMGQLFFAGYVLLGFIFSVKSPFLVLLYLCMMIGIASVEVTSRQSRTYSNHLRDSFLCVAASGGLIGIFGAIIVFNPVPWYQPSVFVPSAGMMIGNSISGPALAVERLLSDISEKKHECETRLAFGASSMESVLPTIRSALHASLIPLINMMSVVGLVSIPGMMTGQLLGGSSPMVAAQYQMAILWLISAVVGVSSYLGSYLALRHAVFDSSHRLTPHRIIKCEKGKVEVEVALYRMLLEVVAYSRKVIGNSRPSNGLSSSPASSTDYDVVGTVADGDRSTHSMMHGLSINSEIDSTHGGKINKAGAKSTSACRATFEMLENAPEASADLEAQTKSAMSNDPPIESAFLHVDHLNVMSGDMLLFGAQGVSFKLRQGERLIISGPSGVGKTRLLRALGQLDEPLLDPLLPVSMGFSQSIFPHDSFPDWRCRVMYVPQAIPPLAGTPKELLLECLGYRSRAEFPAAQKMLLESLETECIAIADRIGLAPEKLDSGWLSLSGGERQRCCIAVALLLAGAGPPAVILLDEPTAACDAETVQKVERAIIESNLTCIIITHDSAQAQRLSHKRLIVKLFNEQTYDIDDV